MCVKPCKQEIVRSHPSRRASIHACSHTDIQAQRLAGIQSSRHTHTSAHLLLRMQSTTYRSAYFFQQSIAVLMFGLLNSTLGVRLYISVGAWAWEVYCGAAVQEVNARCRMLSTSLAQKAQGLVQRNTIPKEAVPDRELVT